LINLDLFISPCEIMSELPLILGDWPRETSRPGGQGSAPVRQRCVARELQSHQPGKFTKLSHWWYPKSKFIYSNTDDPSDL